MDRLAGFLERLTAAIGHYAEQFGAPGLALVAFFDSSFLSLPEVADALLVIAVIQRPELWPYYAAATTAGSMAGCYALYELARRGGEAFLRRRIGARHIDRGIALFQRYGLLAIVVPSLLPPPMPFKVFILLSGVAQVRLATFLMALAIGRGIRYGGEAWLASRYGPQASQYFRDNLPTVALWAVAALTVGTVVYFFWRRRQAA
jgi:membrane protein YqaA with SNARE-associated domain